MVPLDSLEVDLWARSIAKLIWLLRRLDSTITVTFD